MDDEQTIVRPARILRTLQIADPRLLEFVRALHRSDDVAVTYSIVIAAGVIAARG